MLDKNKYTPPCLFSEQIISFLYEEIGVQETNDFEAHLKSCTFCLEELSDFGAVRSSIDEWRKEEFSLLETPAFNFLPAQTEKIHLAPVLTGKNWWLALKERLLTPSPVWATSAFAALIICIGLAFIIFNYSKYDEVAEISNRDNTTPVSPIIETKNELNKNIIPDLNPSEKLSKKYVKEQQFKQENTSATGSVRPVPRNFVTKITNDLNTVTNRNSPPHSNKSAPINRKPTTNKEVKKTPLSKPQNFPFLADIEDVEDDSLRLADLFDETDAK